jgi:hypothetical protein
MSLSGNTISLTPSKENPKRFHLKNKNTNINSDFFCILFCTIGTTLSYYDFSLEFPIPILVL